MLRLPGRKPHTVSSAELREYRKPIGEHPFNVGRTRGYLVAFDWGSKGPAIAKLEHKVSRTPGVGLHVPRVPSE